MPLRFCRPFIYDVAGCADFDHYMGDAVVLWRWPLPPCLLFGEAGLDRGTGFAAGETVHIIH
jgi:hypothetical protein